MKVAIISSILLCLVNFGAFEPTMDPKATASYSYADTKTLVDAAIQFGCGSKNTYEEWKYFDDCLREIKCNYPEIAEKVFAEGGACRVHLPEPINNTAATKGLFELCRSFGNKDVCVEKQVVLLQCLIRESKELPSLDAIKKCDPKKKGGSQ